MQSGDFVEHASYSGNRYGTLRSELERHLERGSRWCSRSRSRERARSAQTMPEAMAVFIAPPSRDALRARLVGRGTDSPEQVDERMRTADASSTRCPSSGTWSSTTGSSEATEELVGIGAHPLASANAPGRYPSRPRGTDCT